MQTTVKYPAGFHILSATCKTDAVIFNHNMTGKEELLQVDGLTRSKFS